MRFRESLQVNLQSRYRRLYKSSMDSFDANVRYFFEWADGVPALASMFDAVERSAPELHPAEWWDAQPHRRPDWPHSEAGRAKVVLWQLRQVANGDAEGYRVAWAVSGESNANDAIREFCDEAVEPLVEYLQERLGAENDLLYLLERYRRWVAWFEQDRLWAAYEADSARGEALYDKDLRQFLFDQGVDYPLSQPASPSGKADILADVDGNEPLACEVKLFDADRYGVPYVAKGLQQALRYAEDYGHESAYLVVFNLSDRALELPTDDEDAGWPPRLNVAGVTIFLVVVQARPLASASTSGAAKPVKATRPALVKSAD